MTLRKITFIFFLSVLTVRATAVADKPLTAVADLRYGVALYHYYQGDYMSALSELLVAKKRGGIQGHGDSPEIMEGGFALGYGMERYASDIFERLLEQNRSVSARDAAWFFLAKMRYLRGDWLATQDALERISEKPSSDIHEEIQALKVNLAIKQDQLAEAEAMLKKSKFSQGWAPYIYFNLGSAWARQQNFESAINYYNYLAQVTYPEDEHRALYDKAMTAAGYCYLLSKRYSEAQAQFSRVRLGSSLGHRALLGYGWASAEKGEYEEALKPWQYLSKSVVVDENSQEALIAVPYAYEKLGSEGLALKSFKQAEESFLGELARLDELIANLQGDAMLQALEIERSQGMDWLKYAEKNQLSPQLSYLAELFSREEFQGLVQELRDLLSIQENLKGWDNKLTFYGGMLNEREFGRTQKAKLLAESEIADNIAKMARRRSELAQNIEQIAAQKNYFALASGDDADLILRAERSKKHIEALRQTDPFIEENEEAIRRYHGLLLWDASEKFSGRLWRAIKALNALDTTIGEIRKNHANVITAMNEAPDLDPYRQRMALAKQTLSVRIVEVDKAVSVSKDGLRAQVVSVLLAQKERINHYLAQSRLSVARLYDKASLESEQ